MFTSSLSPSLRPTKCLQAQPYLYPSEYLSQVETEHFSCSHSVIIYLVVNLEIKIISPISLNGYLKNLCQSCIH